MANDRGRNSGVTGLVDLPGQAAKFEARIYGYASSVQSTIKPRLGRGASKWAKVRILFSFGTISLRGTVRLDGTPAPDDWHGETGTVTIQVQKTHKVQYPVVVESAGFKLDEEREDTHKVTLACRLTGPPVFTGWTPRTASALTKTDLELYQGTAKITDPNGLLSGATRTIDVWGNLNDTDAAEETKLADVIAAAQPPIAGTKLRTATFQRDSDDGGTITLTYGLTSTADDVLQPLITYDIDPAHLNSRTQVAQFHDEPPPPNSVHPDDAQVLIGKHRHNLNDGTILHVHQYGRRDSVQAVEEDNTVTVTDPNNLASHATAAKVNAAASLPAGFVLRQIERRDLNPTQYLEKHHGGLRDTIEDITMPGTWTYTDLHGIDSNGFDTDVYNTLDPVPADPTPPAGQQIVGSRIEQIDRLHSQRRVEFAVLNSKQRVEFPRRKVVTDPHNLGSLEVKSEVFTNGTPPTTPTIAGLKLVDYQDEPVTQTQSVRVWQFAKLDARDRLILPHSVTDTDPSGLSNRVTRAELDSVPTLPGGYVNRGVRVEEVAPGRFRYVIEGGTRSLIDDHEMDATASRGDVDRARQDAVAEVIDCNDSDTAASLCAAEFSLRNNVSTFIGVEVKKLNPRQALRVVRSESNDKISDSFGFGGVELCPARLFNGQVQVYIAHRMRIDSTWTKVMVAPQYIHRVHQRFSLRRRRAQTPVPHFLNRVGTANQSPFLGLPADTVTYVGDRARSNLSLLPAQSWMEYLFEYDSLGQFTLHGITLGWHDTSAPLPSVQNGPGWVNAAELGWTLAGPLPRADFSVFEL